MAITTPAAIIEAVGKCAEALMWFIKYKLFSAQPKRREELQQECKAIENEISEYRKKIAQTDSSVVANFYNDECDGLRVALAGKRRELEYLSDIGLKDSGGNGN